MLFAGKMYGSTSLVRPKRVIYPGYGESELVPINHEVAKQKLETLFNKKGIKKKDPLQLLTKPKKKQNMLKKLPNDRKYNPGKSFEKNIWLKSEVKFNRTGVTQTKRASNIGVTNNIHRRLTTTKSKNITESRGGTKQGKRTRAQIITEFFCSQNWNYLARKSLMMKNEREGFKSSIEKFRRVKNGFRKFWLIYKSWKSRVQEQKEKEEEEKELLKQMEEIERKIEVAKEEAKIREANNEEKRLEEEKQKKAEPDEI